MRLVEVGKNGWNWKGLKFFVSIGWNWLKWFEMSWSRLK